MLKIFIKNATIEDLPRVIHITKLAYKIPYKTNSLITKSHEPKNIKELFLKKDFYVIVALINEKIVGAVRYKIDNDNNLYFYRLAVPKRFRNKGIGSLLVAEIEKTAQKKGCNNILLDCAKEKKLPEYYKKLGYKIDKIKKHLDHHDVYMSKNVK